MSDLFKVLARLKAGRALVDEAIVVLQKLTIQQRQGSAITEEVGFGAVGRKPARTNRSSRPGASLKASCPVNTHVPSAVPSCSDFAASRSHQLRDVRKSRGQSPRAVVAIER